MIGTQVTSLKECKNAIICTNSEFSTIYTASSTHLCGFCITRKVFGHLLNFTSIDTSFYQIEVKIPKFVPKTFRVR